MLERFLTLAAEDNIQVVYPSTPAQYFHVLRRQVLRLWRKPLIVMTPKSLLRHPQVVSTIDELADGGFARILTTADCDPNAPFSRVLVCTGKIYYELEAARRERAREDVAIVRLEQLYPLADEAIERVLARCPVGAPIIWVQEEPENMGAWNYFRLRFSDALPERPPILGVTREESASPATGSARSHELTQRLLIEEAFGDIPDRALVDVGPRGKRVNLRAGREGER
jgi:2-oxoglutarate dehydrogenase E1 component